MAFYQPSSRRIPEATDKRGEKIFEPKTHCEVGFVLEALRSHEPGRWLGVAETMPRRINAPSDYHPQKIFAVASLNALLQNRDAIFDHQRPNAATAMAQAQAAIALRFNNPAFYVSREILNAALRTDLPSDLVLEAIAFPFPAIIFVLPIGGVRHETEGDIPYICVSRFYGDEIVPLPISGYDFPLRIENPSVSVTTYMHQAPVSVAYYKNVTPIPGKTIQECLIEAGSEPFSFTILTGPRPQTLRNASSVVPFGPPLVCGDSKPTHSARHRFGFLHTELR